MRDLSLLREDWEAIETEETRLLRVLTFQESVRLLSLLRNDRQHRPSFKTGCADGPTGRSNMENLLSHFV